MFAAESHTSRHHIVVVAMACLCVLLGGPTYAAGAESLIIAGATYCEPGASGSGWAWTDADHLELNGYTGEAIGADGDLVVTLTGLNTVVETSAPDVDISRCGMEVWGDLTLRGTGSLVATGSQCGIYASGTLAVDGCKVDARADGAGIADARVAGVIADGLAVRGGGPVVPGDGPSAPGTDPATGEPAADSSTNPTPKPAAATKTVTTTTVTNTTAAKTSRPKAATATSSSLPKTGDSHWIAVSGLLFALGTAVLKAARRC